ncbi:hypothetical protein HDU99_010774, partial [Rhizoclosmatium hyalinum]
MTTEEAESGVSTATAPPYYMDATFDPHRATIAELKTILSKHNVSLPTGRVLKEEYVSLFRGMTRVLQQQLDVQNGEESEDSHVALAAEPEAELLQGEGLAQAFENIGPDAPPSCTKNELKEDIQDVQEPVNTLISKFTELAPPPSPHTESQIEYMTTAIANAVQDRKKKLMEFGKGIRSSFGFARRTVFDPNPIPAPRPEKLRRSGPPPLPPPPANPQQNLRHLSSPDRPDFVVPVVPPTFISQTGLSPPVSVIQKSVRRAVQGSPKSPTNTTPRAGSHGQKMSPLGLRSTGPRRVPQKVSRDQVIVTRTPPFNPHRIPSSILKRDSSLSITGEQGGGEDLDDNVDENGENTQPPLQPSSHYKSNNPLILDAEFKRKYDLDEFSDEEVEAETLRNQISPKRRKSVVGSELEKGLKEMDVPRVLPRELYLKEVGASPGRYNLRTRTHGGSLLVTDSSTATRKEVFPEDDNVVASNGLEGDALEENEYGMKSNETEEEEEVEIEIILKPDALRRVLRTFGWIFSVALVVPAIFAFSCWWVDVGSKIQYCFPGQDMQWITPVQGSVNGLAKDFWGQILPSCVACPSGAICTGAKVIGCENQGKVVVGDEGFGPLSEYVGLPIMCMDKDQVTWNEEFEKSNIVDHVNPRIKGVPLPLTKRIKFWNQLIQNKKESFNSLVAQACQYVVSGKAAKEVKDVLLSIHSGFVAFADTWIEQ